MRTYFHFGITLFFLAGAFMPFNSLAQSASNYRPFHLTSERSEGLAKKVKRAVFQQKTASIVAFADSILNTKVAIPTIPGAWPHHYVDPEEGKMLIPGKYLGNWQWEHHNADRSKVYRADETEKAKRYDQVLILTKVHHGYADAMLAMGFAYQLSQNPAYLRKIEDILLAYAAVYEQIPLHNKEMVYNPNEGTGNGRLAAQALGESVWLCKVTQALDMVWGALDEQVKVKTEKGLLRPAVDVIMESALTYQLKIHNIRCWYLAAIGTTGLLLQDSTLVNWALHEDKYALEVQLKKGFTKDGLWYERAPSYHFYAINPILYFVNASANRGFTDFKPRLREIIMSYAKFAHPETLEVPRYNDCRSTFLDNAAHFFSYAHSAMGGADIEALLGAIEQKRANLGAGTKYDPVGNAIQGTLNEIIFSGHLPENMPEFAVLSENYPNSGYAVFNQLNGNKGFFLTVKYDAYEGEGNSMWHQHHDQLNFSLFWGQDLIFADPGHAEYGAPAQNEWYRTSLAHNTLTVDYKNQERKPSKCYSYSANQLNAVVVGNDQLFPGVDYQKGYVVVDDSTLLIIEYVQADTAHVYDLAMHPKGQLNADLKHFSTFKPTKESAPYRYLKDPKVSPPLQAFTFNTTIDKGDIHLSFASDAPAEIILANGYGPDFEVVPVAIARAKAKDFSCAWLVQLGHRTHELKTNFKNDQTVLCVGAKNYTFDKINHQLEETP